MDFFVNMHNGIHNHYSVNDSPYAAEGVNWPTTMAELAAKHCPKGPTGHRLEINSHGWPAQILLQPYVNFQNLHQFTTLVRRLIKPGGAIEILSCWVAAFPADDVADALLASRPSAPPPSRAAAPARGLVFHATEPTPPKLTLSGPQVRLLAMRAIASHQELIFPTHFTGGRTPAPGTSEYAAAANGPLFCTRLAKATRCVVRAAMIPQLEEGEGSGNRWFNTPIGNWEGHVLDFQPTGDVRYAGFNVPRPVFRTHDEHGDGPLRVV